jgi:5-methylcytosine-specific restriction endonuclease McrA
MKSLAHLSNTSVMTHLKRLSRLEQEQLAEFLHYLAEVDERRLYADEGYPSLFEFCVEGLGLTEAETCNRRVVARLARQFPHLLPLISKGEISLTVARTLAPYMNDELLAWACGKSTREVERKAAALRDAADAAVRAKARHSSSKLGLDLIETPVTPADGEAEEKVASIRPDKTRYVREDVVEIRFTAKEAVREKLERARAVAAMLGVEGSLEAFMDHCLEIYLERKDPVRRAARRVKAPEAKRAKAGKAQATTRPYVPASLEQTVTLRDGYRCTHHTNGLRCSAAVGLHLDHIIPLARGGAPLDPENLRWLCPAHNRLAADRALGRDFMSAKIASSRTERAFAFTS